MQICIAPRREHLTSKALSVDHTVSPANTPHLPLPRSSPVIAPADEAYYSFIDLVG